MMEGGGRAEGGGKMADGCTLECRAGMMEGREKCNQGSKLKTGGLDRKRRMIFNKRRACETSM